MESTKPELEAHEVGMYLKENLQVQPDKGSVSICGDCIRAADENRPELHCGPRGQIDNRKCACQHRHGEVIHPETEPATGPAGE